MRSLHTTHVRGFVCLLVFCLVFAHPLVAVAGSGDTALTPLELLEQFRRSKVRGVAVYSYYNGYTGLDSTMFWLVGPNPSLPSVLTAFLDSLFSHPIARDASWDNEIKRSSREVSNITTHEMHATANRARLALLKGTPYAELMFETALSDVKPEAVSEFMRREYSP
jgi:hypothetical protein